MAMEEEEGWRHSGMGGDVRRHDVAVADVLHHVGVAQRNQRRRTVPGNGRVDDQTIWLRFEHEQYAPGKSKPRNTMIADLATVGRAKRVDIMSGGDTVQAPAGEHPHVQLIRPGEKTNIGTVIFFHEGSVLLDQHSKIALQVAAESMAGKPQKIEIRGHTTHRPLPENSPYQNHLELGFAGVWPSVTT